MERARAEAALREARATLELRVAERTAELVAAVEELRTSKEQQAFLLQLGDALRPLTDAVAIQRTAARLLGEEVGGGPGLLRRHGRGGGHRHHPPRVHPARGPSSAGKYPYEDFCETVAGLEGGEPFVVPDVQGSAALSERTKAAYAPLGLAAFATVPLIKGGTLICCLTITSETPRAWTERELALERETAERTWDAAERARIEAALRVSEERLRLLVGQMPAALWTTDRDLRLTALMGAAAPAAAQAGSARRCRTSCSPPRATPQAPPRPWRRTAGSSGASPAGSRRRRRPTPTRTTSSCCAARRGASSA